MLEGDMLGGAVATGRLGLLGSGSDKLCPLPWYSVHYCLSLPCLGPSLHLKKPLLFGKKKDKLQDLSAENRIKCKKATPHSQSLSKSQYDKV